MKNLTIDIIKGAYKYVTDHVPIPIAYLIMAIAALTLFVVATSGYVVDIKTPEGHAQVLSQAVREEIDRSVGTDIRLEKALTERREVVNAISSNVELLAQKSDSDKSERMMFEKQIMDVVIDIKKTVEKTNAEVDKLKMESGQNAKDIEYIKGRLYDSGR